MSREAAAKIQAIVHSARVDREGSWKLTLEVTEQDGPKVAALSLHTEEVFEVEFYPSADKS